MSEFPPCPASLKSIQHFLKTAQEHEGRDVVVVYWCRLYALQVGLKLSTHQQDETKLLMALMDWLEKAKKESSDNESITNEVAAQAHLENYALKLFLYADKQDREGNYGKNVVKAFYSSGIIYDVLQTFGELTEEVTKNRKYAKWKAAYIHNCLKNGEIPVPGPMESDEATGGEGPNEGAGGQDPSPPPQHTPDQPGPSSHQWSPISPESDKDVPPSNITAEQVLQNPDMLPKPPVEEEKYPGGFVPYVPPSAAKPPPSEYVPPSADVELTPDQVTKAQKYCKYAGSALLFNDIQSAIQNIQKAYRLLTTGVDE